MTETTTIQTPTLTFEQFWSWLGKHRNCILRAGTPDCWLYDLEDFHWSLEWDAGGSPAVQLVSGKMLVAELGLDVRELLFVQAMPDPESTEQGQTLFELVGGPKDDPYALYSFVLSHPYDEERGHPGTLKH